MIEAASPGAGYPSNHPVQSFAAGFVGVEVLPEIVAEKAAVLRNTDAHRMADAGDGL